MIGLADKLSNMRDIDRDYPVMGDRLWLRFRMQSRLALAWYYKGVRDALRDGFEGTEAYEEYCSLIDKNFGPGPAPAAWKEQDGQETDCSVQAEDGSGGERAGA